MRDRSRPPGLLRRAHRAIAALVGAFALMHLSHHLVALASIDAHLAVGRALRVFYRHPGVEPILLLAVAIQWATGVTLAYKGWRIRDARVHPAARLRRWSGITMALFLPIHVLAVLQARDQGLDTNFFFAAAGLHDPGAAPFFALYYGLGVTALVSHLGLAICRSKASTWWPLCALAGVATGVTLVLVLGGLVHPFSLPDNYRWKVP